MDYFPWSQCLALFAGTALVVQLRQRLICATELTTRRCHSLMLGTRAFFLGLSNPDGSGFIVFSTLVAELSKHALGFEETTLDATWKDTLR